jgi:phosphoglycolate phosphatase-like HAD superfamily hydrolase
MGTSDLTAKQGVLLDLDGTLVDSVYHHVRIWCDILQSAGHRVEHWHVHRAIGMSSARLVPWLTGTSDVDTERLTQEHERRFLECASKLSPTHGAQALLDDLAKREVPHHVVTSAAPAVRRVLFEVLGQELPTTDAGVDAPTKPAANPVLGGASSLGIPPERLTFVGDSVWDGEAARRACVHFIAVRSGGFADGLLLQSGALWVENAPRDLIGRL